MSLNITTRLTGRSAANNVIRAGIPTCARKTFSRAIPHTSSIVRRRADYGDYKSASLTLAREYHPSPTRQKNPTHPARTGKNPVQLNRTRLDIDGTTREFAAVFLRDSCTCPRCVDPHSKQKLFQTSDIPLEITGTARAVEDTTKGQAIEVTWDNDVPGYDAEHRTLLSLEQLRQALNTEAKITAYEQHDDRVFWDREIITKNNKWVDYKDWMEQDEVLFDALTHLNQYGLLFLRSVPDSEASVIDIAGRIGTLKDTFYGRTWDVRSKPKAENIAYTPQFLGLHMDLLYTSNPPHLQLLHSLRARTPGGESFFSDAFHAAQKLAHVNKAQFSALCSFPVTYHYHHPTHHYHHTRLTIETHAYLKGQGQDFLTRLNLKRVNWSPPFQGPFETDISGSAKNSRRNLRAYLDAAHAYEKILSAEESLFEYRLNEGECVIFDNRRVLHARRAFDATKGERWLKGAYVDDDVFFSKLRVLQERFTGKWVADGVVRSSLP